MLRLIVTAKVSSSPILVTMMMEAIFSSETWVLTRATRRNIPKDGILQVQVKTKFIEQWLQCNQAIYQSVS
jgi:hypothetical protein